MVERHSSSDPVDQETPPELFWADKNPEEWVGREYVGERQRTITTHGQDDAVEYRVGLNELHEIVIDRINLDRFVQSPEPTSVKFEDAPERVRKEAIDLLAEHVPEAAHGSDD